MARRVRLGFLGPAALLVVGGAYALASGDWCGEWPEAPPRLESSAAAEGALRAGFAEVELNPPYPVTVAGYGPPRSEASGARLPLQARAVVLEVGGVRVGLVSLDLLTAPETLVEEVRGRCRDLNLGTLWVIASHTHSGFGEYDPRLISELAGTGRYRESAEVALALGAAQAVHRAAMGLAPATLAVSTASAAAFVRSRDEGEPVDPRWTKLVLRTPQGEAQLWVLAAHPTLVPRRTPSLDPDYPGRVDARERAADAGMTLILQGAVGNAAAALDGGAATDADAFAERLVVAADAMPVTPAAATLRLAYATVRTRLPRPDATRLVRFWFARAPGDNFLCASAPKLAEVGAMALGPLTLLSLPGEMTADAAAHVESAAGAGRVLSVANGYVGYVESAARVKANEAEAHRQYFGPGLEDVLARAAALAAHHVAR